MHVVLDGRAAGPHFPGIGRYVRNLSRALLPALVLVLLACLQVLIGAGRTDKRADSPLQA